MTKTYSASVSEISRSGIASAAHDSDQTKLSETEKSLILKQLTDWSTFGTYSQNDIDPKTIFSSVPSASSCNDLDNKLYYTKQQPTPNSHFHLATNDCKYFENFCNQIHHNHQQCRINHHDYHHHEPTPPPHHLPQSQPPKYKSTPDLRDRFCYSDGRKKFPEAYIVKKCASGASSTSKIDSNLNIKFTDTALIIDKRLSINSSCPELSQTMATSKIILQTVADDDGKYDDEDYDDDDHGGNNSDGELPHTPIHSNTTNLTLKQLKNHFNKKFNKFKTGTQPAEQQDGQQTNKFGGRMDYFSEFKG